MDEIIQELYKNFVELHKNQFVTNNIPEIYWNSILTKLRDEVFDAGNYFQIMQVFNEDDEFVGVKAVVKNEDGLKCTDSNGIFLIDHAWTYRINEARSHLLQIDGLIERMVNLMNLSVPSEDEELSDEDKKNTLVDLIMENMWRFNQTYNLSFENMTDEERESLWYIMDEFGTSVRHSDNPTVKCAPFYYLATRTMYTLMWPVHDLSCDDEITRDYTYAVKDEQLRKAKLVPWFHSDCTDIDIENEEPNDDYFMMAREDERLPTQKDLDIVFSQNFEFQPDKVYKVYTDIEMVREFLNDRVFKLVDSESEADIIFIKRHFKNYKYLAEKNPTTLINQFPFENVVTVKDLLAIVCRRINDSSSWLPMTYNLKYELPKFISCYQRREKDELDNYWIVKPWNLARSIDTYVTKNLNQIIRLQESSPKIVCKYITNPVLFHREELNAKVKFDIRYIVMLRSTEPLTIFTYNIFWLRFANKPYSLDDLHDYEKHFTVMNYRPVNLRQINCDEFILSFEQQNPNHRWNDIQDKIFKMIRQVFEGATNKQPPRGIMNNPQSRAMYAIDLMLDWRENDTIMEPMICEINFLPDCARACRYHPSFFNDIFYTLFLDKPENRPVTRIC